MSHNCIAINWPGQQFDHCSEPEKWETINLIKMNEKWLTWWRWEMGREMTPEAVVASFFLNIDRTLSVLRTGFRWKQQREPTDRPRTWRWWPRSSPGTRPRRGWRQRRWRRWPGFHTPVTGRPVSTSQRSIISIVNNQRFNEWSIIQKWLKKCRMAMA